jgi:hypothetical protein
LDAAEWLASVGPEPFELLRQRQVKMRILVDVRIDQDQFELELPPELTACCGRARLGIYLISND